MQIKNVRFIVAAITTFSAYAVYVSRVNLSIAIIAMVDDDHHAAAVAAAAASNHSQLLSNNNNTQPVQLGLDLPPAAASDGENSVSSNTQSQQLAGNHSTLTPNANNNGSSASGQLRAPLTTIFLTSKKSVKTPLISQEKFHWDQTEQGHILGAFFYGYILFQVPGARMAESVGAKWIIMAANAGSAVISLAFPLSTQLNSIHLLMVLRFVMGLCQSAFFPAAYVLFCRWLPERERAVLLPIMFIGSNVGSISTYTMSSYLIHANYGWPSVFYLSGLVCTLVTILWCIFGSSGPEDNWLITASERQFILHSVNNSGSESNSLDDDDYSEDCCSSSDEDDVTRMKRIEARKLAIAEQKNAASAAIFNVADNGGRIRTRSGHSCHNHSRSRSCSFSAGCHGVVTPKFHSQDPSWPKLLKSIPVWTLILSMYGNEWSNVVICYEFPTFLNKALSFPIEQNGVINSFFQLSYAVASPIMSSLGAYMLARHVFGMRKIHVRKLFQSLATFGQFACFLSVPICGANRGLITTFMFLAIVFKACANAGDIMVSGDLSPEYAGTIFAFANSVGNTAGFFAPLLTGVFVENAYAREQWTPFWLATAAIMASSGLIFLVFGETRRQDYSLLGDGPQIGEDGDDDQLAQLKTIEHKLTSIAAGANSHNIIGLPTGKQQQATTALVA